MALTGRGGGFSEDAYASLNLALHVADEPDRVVANRRHVAATIDAELDDLVFAAQVHGAGVVRVRAGDRGRGARVAADAFPDADALVTGEPGPVLVVLGADCPLVALVDPRARALGVAHAGWRGIAAGVLEATIDTMATELGADPAQMRAAVSPAIGPCCYEVGPEVVEAIGASHARPSAGDRAYADLRGAVETRLREARVTSPIEGEPVCTVCHADRFFSHRGAGGRPTGRHALMAQLA